MTETLRDISALVEAGLVPSGEIEVLNEVARRYAVAMTPTVAALVDRSDPADPIARQFVPDVRELETQAEERADPIGDEAHSPVDGLVHRHRDRVLLKIVAVCPVYCRFCFRRSMVGPGSAHALTPEKIERALAYIATHDEIWEVILTGGDPFVLTPRRAREITERLSAIPHVKIIRWHTRIPVVDPGQVTEAFVNAIVSGNKTVYVAVHANHPRELTDAARSACARLVGAGIPLISQTVLLKGVNDDVDTLEKLMRAFLVARIKPYYLHHCDLAPGTAHFRLSIAEGQALMRALRARVSGLALPTYVLDIPGGYGKIPVGPHYADDPATDQVRDARGVLHRYQEP